MWMIYPLLFFAAFVDSIAGGGGLISLPGYLAVGLPAHLALGTNKFTSCWGTGLSALQFARKGHINWRSALLAFAGAFLGSMGGARLALHIDERALTWVFLVVLPCVGAFVLFKRDLGAVGRVLSDRKLLLYSLLVGFGIGMYDGFMGPGTGTFLIIAFTVVLGFPLLTACGNTKVVNFASNLAALGMFMWAGTVNYRIAIPGALCSLAGNYIGTQLAMRKGIKIVRPMMMFVVCLLLLKILWDLI